MWTRRTGGVNKAKWVGLFCFPTGGLRVELGLGWLLGGSVWSQESCSPGTSLWARYWAGESRQIPECSAGKVRQIVRPTREKYGKMPGFGPFERGLISRGTAPGRGPYGKKPGWTARFSRKREVGGLSLPRPTSESVVPREPPGFDRRNALRPTGRSTTPPPSWPWAWRCRERSPTSRRG